MSSKFDELESPEQLIGRIEEAARFYPRDQLALSTQCGFASAGPGNAISEDGQERKLQLIAAISVEFLAGGIRLWEDRSPDPPKRKYLGY